MSQRGDSSAPPSADVAGDGIDRRVSERIDVTWSVDCETEDTFLYASITNISEMGIFVRTTKPLIVGSHLTLRFSPGATALSGDDVMSDRVVMDPFVLKGVVQWVNPVRPLSDNPNPGMGVRFIELTAENRERLVEVVHTIAYLREDIDRAPISRSKLN